MQPTGLEDGLLGKCLNDGGLVARGVDELVVENLDVRVLGREHDDLVGDGGGVGKGRDVLANAGEADLKILAVGAAELGLGLLADDGKIEAGLLGVETTDISAQTRVNTTAETLVGGADDEQGLALTLELGSSGLGGLVDLVGSLTVALGVVHGTLSTSELGRGDNLHGVGNLLDVANRLEAALDLTKSRKGGGRVGASNGSSTRP